MPQETETTTSPVQPLDRSDADPLRQNPADQVSRQFRMLVDEVEDYAIYQLDPEGRVMSWNKGAERIKGYRAKEIIGKHFSVFSTPEDIERGKPAQELQIAAEKGRFEDESWRVCKGGDRIWANVVITALRDENGKLFGFSKITRDLTERKKLEEELRQASAALEQKVQERTAELAKVNASLQGELQGRKQAQEAIRALSTPVLPLRDRLLILPIIGIIDSQRALQLTEQLLNSIRSYRAKAVVMDITGVPVVDTRVANHLLQTVEAARLMGASVIVTGLSPEISQTLVRIGVDLSRLKTMGDLRGGLEEAEQLLGYTLITNGASTGQTFPS